jgi:hypothetical protein
MNIFFPAWHKSARLGIHALNSIHALYIASKAMHSAQDAEGVLSAADV